ncbi:MscL family protein [Weissella confusa]|nr:MscL family protein [Weissella confusa]
MRNFINEFRDFIMRGNVMDLAVAFINNCFPNCC